VFKNSIRSAHDETGEGGTVTDLLAKLRQVLTRSEMTQEVNTVRIDFDEHDKATEFFDTLVETCEPDADAIIDDLQELSS
jgi:hypothetical protein